MAPKRVRVIDKGFRRALRSIKRLNGLEATIGLHPGQSGRKESGPIDNVGLGFVHEFGVTINHPGGTDYMVSWSGGGRSGGMVGGGITFLPRGDPRSIGRTRPHIIRIPERSFMRSSFDKNVRKYQRGALREIKRAIIGKQSPEKAIGRLGEIVRADIIRGINRGISPPLKPATIRRKRSSKPLVDTGQLKQALRVEVGRLKR